MWFDLINAWLDFHIAMLKTIGGHAREIKEQWIAILKGD